MTIHYHGTPITPISVFEELKGRHFCVSFAAPKDIKRAHKFGQSVMLDNGAFSLWRANKPTNWPGYYRWCERWLQYPATWGCVPDVIDGAEELQDNLLDQWPFGDKGAPVWHMNEDIERLLNLLGQWPRVCIGSTSIYAVVLSPAWRKRMDQIWKQINRHYTRPPWVHMLRGMACVKYDWPFASVDSTDIARNHNRAQNTPLRMAERWDALQCGGKL